MDARRVRRMATVRLVAGVTGAILLVSSAGPAVANHDRVEGGFSAEAPPAPRCDVGINEVAETFTTPFGGFMFVQMTGFVGDWDLYLRDAEGNKIKASTNSNDPVYGNPDEKLGVWVEGGRKLSIVACNWAGGRSAEVDYSFFHVAPPKPVKIPKKRVERTWVGPYVGPAVGIALTGGQVCHVGFDLGCAATDAYYGTDRFVTAKVTDESGLPVAAAVYQYAGDDQGPAVSSCGETHEPIKLMPEVDWVGVELLVGPCLDGTPAAATTGEVELTFSSRR